MKQCFDAVKNRLLEQLSEEGFQLTDEKGDDLCRSALFTGETEAVKLEYSAKDKLFSLYRGSTENLSSLARVQTYLFDKEAGDDTKQAIGVANEFIDTLSKKSGKGLPAPQQKKRRDPDSDESSADFFVNRIPSVMPECREPLLKHKNHYGCLLPRWFCEEVVTVAVKDMLKTNDKQKCKGFFELISNMYAQGDLDTKAIIMQVIMPSITDERDMEYVQSLLGKELLNGIKYGKRYFGKEVKPEKTTAMAKAAAYQADTLRQR